MATSHDRGSGFFLTSLALLAAAFGLPLLLVVAVSNKTVLFFLILAIPAIVQAVRHHAPALLWGATGMTAGMGIIAIFSIGLPILASAALMATITVQSARTWHVPACTAWGLFAGTSGLALVIWGFLLAN